MENKENLGGILKDSYSKEVTEQSGFKKLIQKKKKKDKDLETTTVISGVRG